MSKNGHIKHGNRLSIYENMDYFQIMYVTVTCWKCQNILHPCINKIYFYVFCYTNVVEILLKPGHIYELANLINSSKQTKP